MQYFSRDTVPKKSLRDGYRKYSQYLDAFRFTAFEDSGDQRIGHA
jgi:hypothetical protein